jgi:hypothetical protein
MAVKNIATRQAWGLFGMDEGLTTCRTKADNYNDISGYGNCEHIRTNRGNFDSYPAFKAAYDYNTTCPVPATTTGWYLPANGGTSCKIWAVVRLWRTLPSKPRQTLENSSGRAKEMFPPL